jgi:hypothetical protein
LLERILFLEARTKKDNHPTWEADLHEIKARIDRGWVRVPSSMVQAGWRNVHEVSAELVLTDSDALVYERLASACSQLKGIPGERAKDLVKRIEGALAEEPTADEGGRSSNRRELLREADLFRHDTNDRNYEDLAGLLGKAVWLTLVALAIVVGLAVLFDRESYFLFGAAGALISRLSRVLKRRPSASDWGAEWSTLVLSPAAGAVAGWMGVLVTSVLAREPFGVLSDHFIGPWNNASQPLGFAVAFVFGFSERLFNRLLGTAVTQVGGALPKEEKDGGASANKEDGKS